MGGNTFWFFSGARVVALPSHGVLTQQRGKQIELFLKQLLVLIELIPEQRKGLRE